MPRLEWSKGDWIKNATSSAVLVTSMRDPDPWQLSRGLSACTLKAHFGKHEGWTPKLLLLLLGGDVPGPLPEGHGTVQAIN